MHVYQDVEYFSKICCKLSMRNIFVLMYRDSLTMLVFCGRCVVTSGTLCISYINSQDEKPKRTKILYDSLQVIIKQWHRKLLWPNFRYRGNTLT
jgi:hypothetical protein